MSDQSIFSEIYGKNHWGNGSGPGSSPSTTLSYRYLLESFIYSNNIRSVLDVGCGDWQHSRYIPWHGIDYVGIDVVPEIIARNIATFGTANISFMAANVKDMKLPPAQLVVIKDVLQHWNNQEIFDFLNKIKTYKFAIITNSTQSSPSNRDILTGGFRPLNILLPPFNAKATVLLRYGKTDEKTVLLIQN